MHRTSLSFVEKLQPHRDAIAPKCVYTFCGKYTKTVAVLSLFFPFSRVQSCSLTADSNLTGDTYSAETTQASAAVLVSRGGQLAGAMLPVASVAAAAAGRCGEEAYRDLGVIPLSPIGPPAQEPTVPAADVCSSHLHLVTLLMQASSTGPSDSWLKREVWVTLPLMCWLCLRKLVKLSTVAE